MTFSIKSRSWSRMIYGRVSLIRFLSNVGTPQERLTSMHLQFCGSNCAGHEKFRRLACQFDSRCLCMFESESECAFSSVMQGHCNFSTTTLNNIPGPNLFRNNLWLSSAIFLKCNFLPYYASMMSVKHLKLSRFFFFLRSSSLMLISYEICADAGL